MIQVKLGRKDEPAISLQESEDLIAIRTKTSRSLLTEPVLSPSSKAIDDSQLVMAFPEANVEVYKVPPSRLGIKSLKERKEFLRMQSDVRFAGGVLIDEQSGDPMIYTENLFLKFIDEAEEVYCQAVIHEAGLLIKQVVPYAKNAFFVAAPEGTGTKVFDLSLNLLQREDIEYCHPELLRQRKFRDIFPQQWHLRNTVINHISIDNSANVEAAHHTSKGEGILIAIIDDGFDIDHPEFSSPSKVVSPRDATLNTNDPRPKDFNSSENHGTACAGVACANGLHGASGVAPEAKLLPIRLASGLGSQQEANSFVWAADQGADIISCSWGPVDGLWYDPLDPRHSQVVPIPASTRLAIDYATTKGRNGKGCIVLFAAGNGNESVDNDGYASYEKVIAVAACNDRGKRSVYSDFGNAIWCAFPSNDYGYADFDHPEPLTPGIWTTDRIGFAGYNTGKLLLGDIKGNYTNDFGGTSSACPGAAGIAALILAVNSNLNRQEVRDILGKSCDKIDTQNGDYSTSGRSKLYGFGRLNAEKAVRLATLTLAHHSSIATI